MNPPALSNEHHLFSVSFSKNGEKETVPFNALHNTPNASCSGLKVYVVNINMPLGSSGAGSCAGGISVLPSTQQTLCSIILLQVTQNQSTPWFLMLSWQILHRYKKLFHPFIPCQFISFIQNQLSGVVTGLENSKIQ